MNEVRFSESAFDDAFSSAVRGAAEADHSALPHCERLGLPPERELRPFSLPALVNAILRLKPRTALRELKRDRNSMTMAQRMIARDLASWRWLYGALADVESRDILITLLAYRALGRRRVKLPLNTPEYWARLEEIEAALSSDDLVDAGFQDWNLHRIDLGPWGHGVDLYTRATAVMTQFLLEQYRCRTGEVDIAPMAGDTAIDAGACYGSTALHFAEQVGPEGHVLSFEFMPHNLSIFRRNLALNPSLAERVEIVEKPLWSETGRPLFIKGHGPATRLSEQGTEADPKVETLAIDDLVSERGLERVDFIKMDIEGAELEALKGAEATLRRFRPKLAICLYHRLSDFHEIPKQLDDLGLGYEFRIRHFTVLTWETVLFASAPDRAG